PPIRRQRARKRRASEKRPEIVHQDPADVLEVLRHRLRARRPSDQLAPPVNAKAAKAAKKSFLTLRSLRPLRSIVMFSGGEPEKLSPETHHDAGSVRLWPGFGRTVKRSRK